MTIFSDPRVLVIGGMVCLGLIALLFNGSRSRGGYQPRQAYQPQGPARTFDEAFPAGPKKVRNGIVAERDTQMLVPYNISAVRHPNPPKTLHYIFRIVYSDVIGYEEDRLVVEQDHVNVLAEVGRPVEVSTQRHRLDHNHMVHSIVAI